MKFYCKYCDYHTERKYNYEKHLESYKHHKNKKETLCGGSQTPCRGSLTLCEGSISYKCQYCNKVLSKNSHYHRHLSVCKEKIILERAQFKKEKEESQEELVKTRELLCEAQTKIKDLEKDRCL